MSRAQESNIVISVSALLFHRNTVGFFWNIVAYKIIPRNYIRQHMATNAVYFARQTGLLIHVRPMNKLCDRQDAQWVIVTASRFWLLLCRSIIIASNGLLVVTSASIIHTIICSYDCCGLVPARQAHARGLASEKCIETGACGRGARGRLSLCNDTARPNIVNCSKQQQFAAADQEQQQ